MIRNGDVLVGRTEHVLQAIEAQLTKRIKPRQRSIDLDLSDKERSIFTLLEHSLIHIDELVKIIRDGSDYTVNYITGSGTERCRATAQW